MFQAWRDISFVHWPYDAATLRPHLPGGLELDIFEGMGWLGLTPFELSGLRPPFLPAVPGLSRFPEMNLRTYVRGPAGPGVWFFSLDAASLPAVIGARLLYGLPYHWARMTVRRIGDVIEYTSTRAGGRAALAVAIGPRLADAGPRARFLTERYRLYATLGGRLATAQVAHEPWPLHRATLVCIAETVRHAAGLPDRAAPVIVHYSPGVHVRVGRLRRA
jgi:uncharacterized protein YqjF (DUF2071 family)